MPKKLIKTKNPINILIGMPNQGTIKTQTIFSLMKLYSQSEKLNINFVFAMPIHTMLLHSRNFVVNMAKDIKFLTMDYIMWIDSDMVFEPQDILTLLKSNKDVITAPAVIKQRDENNKDKIYNISLNKWGKNLTQQDLNTIPQKEFEVYYTGMAFMLCKMKVYDKFKTFKLSENKSEGAYFCDYLRKNKYKIFTNKEVKIGHICENIVR